MHFEAEYWAASHWSYKEWLKRDDQSRFIKNLIKLEEEIQDNDEFLKSIHIDVLNERIFALTPKWDIIDLPKWATAIDFAFAIHADVWLKCIWANVNWRSVPLNYILNNWDTVKINTKTDSKPNPLWLNFVKTTKARSTIKKWLSDQNRDLLLNDWIKLLDDCLLKLWKEKLDKNYTILKNFKWKKLNKNEREEILLKIWKWSLTPISIVKEIIWLEKEKKEEEGIEKKEKVKKWKVYFKWWGENYKLMETCCNPQEWDEIIWYVWRWQYIWVHKKDCPFIKWADYKRFIKWYWESDPIEYSADIEIKLLWVAKNSWKIFEKFSLDWVTVSKIFYEEDLNPKFQILIIWVNFTNLNNFSLLVEKIWDLGFVQDVLVKNLRS